MGWDGARENNTLIHYIIRCRHVLFSPHIFITICFLTDHSNKVHWNTTLCVTNPIRG